jgi:hypothetical protein
MTTALPHGPANPLHIIEPLFLALTVALAVVVVLAVVFAVVRLLLWLKRRMVTTPALPPLPPIRDMDQRIARIKKEHLASEAYRNGCHSLSALLKTYLEQQTRQPVEEMTLAEIRRRLDHAEASRFFTRLSDLQFRRAEPGRGEFAGACEESVRLAKKFKRGT